MRDRMKGGSRSLGAHEIGNYLAVIQLNALGLRQRCRPGTADFRRLAAILHAASRAGAVCRRVWLGIRNRPALGEPADLGTIVRSGCAALGRSAGKRLAVSEKSAAPMLVRADPVQVDQILVNLILNSWNAAGIAGKVGVNVGRCARRRCFFEVWDEGPGFASRPRRGGLGLVVVRRLARSLGGALRIESSPGHGTRVRVSLPEL